LKVIVVFDFFFVGMSIVAIPHPNGNKSEFQEADQVLNTMIDFDPSLWGLPSFSSY
jgi:hypothetical protein